MRFYIGVDIGTQGTKGAVVSAAGAAQASYSIEQSVTIPRPGWAEHDAEQTWWGGFVTVIKALLDRSAIEPDDVGAVGLSALMPVMLPVDVDLRPLRPAILYADTRAHGEMTRMNEQLAGERAMPLVGHDVGPKIAWFRDHEPALWDQTATILGAQGYVIAKLTGRRVIDSFTATGLRPYLNQDHTGWDEARCNRFGVPVALLPDVVRMTDTVGAITPEAATATGLAVGTPVIGGATDFIAEMLSTGPVASGDVVVSYGTTFCLAGFSSQPIGPCPGLGRLWQSRSDLAQLYPGLAAIGGGMATSGALSRWFRDHFARAERLAERDSGITAYERLGSAAAAIPAGADGLVVLPYFSGERSPIHDDQARGVIFGLTLAHGRGHVYRALLEGVAYGLQHNLEQMRQAGIDPCRLVATGGGSRSELWTQIVSDVTGLPQQVIAPSEAALGAAFLAGYADRTFSRLSDVGRWARPEREVHPRPHVHEGYQAYYAVYRRLYEQTKEEMHDLARLTAVNHGAHREAALPAWAE